MTKVAPEYELSIDSGSRGTMGPLSVEVYSREGDTVAEFALNSGRRSHGFKASPGQYTIVARRPNGERLRRSVTIDAKPETVFLGQEIGPSPNEFLESETLRGEVRFDPQSVLHKIAFTAATEVFSPMLGRVIGGVASVALKQAIDFRRTRGRRASGARQRVAVWGKPDGVQLIHFSPPSSFLKLNITRPGEVQAVGLLDGSGKGPIVIIPPFRRPVEISFICESLISGTTNRADTASAVRSPVAVVLPGEAAVADLLSAIASPVLDHADELWEDSIQSMVPGPKNAAFDLLQNKFEHPAEALLAAHYVLRFMPQELPLSWADNLMTAMPDAADGPVIAAWVRLSSGKGRMTSRDDEACNREFQARIEEALRRPRVLYSRTRRLLQDGLRLLPKLRKRKSPKASTGEFLDYGAYAGGLEAFWGRGPLSPGLSTPASEKEAPIIVGRVGRDGASFTSVETLETSSP